MQDGMLSLPTSYLKIQGKKLKYQNNNFIKICGLILTKILYKENMEEI
jgi:hypothetical protein